MEHVHTTMLGLLPRRRLFQEAIRRSDGRIDNHNSSLATDYIGHSLYRSNLEFIAQVTPIHRILQDFRKDSKMYLKTLMYLFMIL